MRANSVGERFWSHVHKTPTCWTWTGATRSGGYGVFRDGTRSVSAHRYAWEMQFGPIPCMTAADGSSVPWLVSHACSNRRCVRPDHLRLLPPVAAGAPESDTAVEAEPSCCDEARVPAMAGADAAGCDRAGMESPLMRGLRSWRESIDRGARLSERLASSIGALRDELGALRGRGLELLRDTQEALPPVDAGTAATPHARSGSEAMRASPRP